jgi:hypothetical protein
MPLKLEKCPVHLSELLVNKKKIRGTLSIKMFINTIDDSSSHLQQVSEWLESFISNINLVIDSNSFDVLVKDLGITNCDIYLNTIDPVSGELIIKYSTDRTLVGLLSGDLDQESYDLGKGSLRFDTVNIGKTESPILTLTSPF